MITFDPALRDRMAQHMREHSLHTVPPDDRKRAAVAIVVVDSSEHDDLVDPYPFTADEMSVVPGDIGGLDGSMQGVAGGAAFLLCRRASRMNAHAAQWALPGGRIDPGRPPSRPHCANSTRNSECAWVTTPCSVASTTTPLARAT